MAQESSATTLATTTDANGRYLFDNLVAGDYRVRFTLTESWSTLLLDDERVIHESTPIQPTGEHGWRDTLVLTFRQQRFQGP